VERVRVASTPTLAILAVNGASATTEVGVGTRSPCNASSHIVVEVTYHGSKLPSAPVDVYREVEHGERLVWRGRTDKDGQANPPALGQGNYRIFIDAGRESGAIGLGVDKTDDSVTTCRLNFVAPPPVLVLRDVESPSVVELKSLRGVITDRTGAVVGNTQVVLQQQSRDGNLDVASLQTNSNGDFDFGEHTPGNYRILVVAKGFCHAAINISVSPQGWEGMKVALPVGNYDPSGNCLGQLLIEAAK
jgi:Carboxypeptidase regulatory-like domain